MKKQRIKGLAMLLGAVLVFESSMPGVSLAETISQNTIQTNGHSISMNEIKSQEVSENDVSMTGQDAWESQELIMSENAKTTSEFEEKQPVLSEVRSIDYQSIKLSFTQIDQADGYEVYRSENKGEEPILLTTLPGSFTSYVDSTNEETKVETGVTYYYSIRGYQGEENQRIYTKLSDTKSAKTALDKPVLKSATATAYNTIDIEFDALRGAEGYLVYKKAETEATFVLLGRIEDGQAISFSHTDAKLAVSYTYRICGYRIESGKEVRSDWSEEVTAKTSLTSPVFVGITSVNYKTLKVSYQRVPGATGYQIYRSTKKKSGYKKIGTVKKGSRLYYQDKKCAVGTKYYYKIRAYRKADGKTTYSDFSTAMQGKTTLPATTITSAFAVGADTLSIAWKKIKGANGYAILRSDKKKGTYEIIATVDGGNVIQTTVGGQENGNDYFYKVKAFYKKGKKYTYGQDSKAQKVAFHYFTYAGESYQDKAMRVFGTIYYNKYQSMAIAAQHMTTITINVWDIAPGGGKVTKQKSLTVNTAIAPSVQKIFEEIYEGQEQFPIKAIGGYSFRGVSSTSEHCEGLAIDINPNENYMIEGNGTITSGSLWAPGQNAYSIPADGEVVKIFKKYGFGWGGDGWSSGRRDYMHFSYFGN